MERWFLSLVHSEWSLQKLQIQLWHVLPEVQNWCNLTFTLSGTGSTAGLLCGIWWWELIQEYAAISVLWQSDEVDTLIPSGIML